MGVAILFVLLRIDDIVDGRTPMTFRSIYTQAGERRKDAAEEIAERMQRVSDDDRLQEPAEFASRVSTILEGDADNDQAVGD